MISFLIGLLLGGLVGITFMALFQMSKEHEQGNLKETEANSDERKDSDD